jgi:hypothetical protein
MPYIKKEKRDELDPFIVELFKRAEGEGDLNYIITSLLHKELLNGKLCYQKINNLIGVLECAKLELYRVVAAPYENVKMDENGRVSQLDGDFFKTFVK